MGQARMIQLCRAAGLAVATVLISALLGSAVLTAIVAWADSGRSSAEAISDTLLFFFPAILVISTPLTALGLLLFGLPADFVLRKVEVRTPLAYAGCGTVGGLVLGAIVFGGDPPGPAALAGVGYGVLTSLVFWALFRRWRPAADEA